MKGKFIWVVLFCVIISTSIYSWEELYYGYSFGVHLMDIRVFFNLKVNISDEGNFVVSAKEHVKSGSWDTLFFSFWFTTSYDFENWEYNDLELNFINGVVLNVNSRTISFLWIEQDTLEPYLSLVLWDFESETITDVYPSSIEVSYSDAIMYDFESILIIGRDTLFHLSIIGDSLKAVNKIVVPDLQPFWGTDILLLGWPEIGIVYMNPDEETCLRIFSFGSISSMDSLSEPQIISIGGSGYPNVKASSFAIHIFERDSDWTCYLHEAWLESDTIKDTLPVEYGYVLELNDSSVLATFLDSGVIQYTKWDMSGWSELDSFILPDCGDSCNWVYDYTIEQDAMDVLHIFVKRDYPYSDFDGSSWVLLHGLFDTTAILEEENLPKYFSMSVFPNPFNSSVRISIEGALHATPIRLDIFNLNGCKVAELDRGSSLWEPENDVPAGIYFVRVKMGARELTQKVLYLK